MSNVIEMVLFILTVVAVIILYRKYEEVEPYLLLKLFCYTFLGAFMIHLNGFKLPLGFVVFLLFFRNIPVNSAVKKRAVYVGLIVFLLSVILPFIETKLYEWPRKVQLQDTNFYSGSMVEEWENIKEEFEIMDDYGVKITDFRTVISDEGKFKNLEITLVEDAHPYMIYYTLNLLDDGKSVKVKRKKVEENQWEGLNHTEAHYLLANIDLITKPMLNDEEIKYHEIRTDGQRMGYDVREQAKFSVDTSGKEKIENSQLPVDGILVEVCGTSGTIDRFGSIFEYDTHEHYILDMLEREVEISESSVLTVARNRSPEIDQWLNKHTGDQIAIEVNGEYVIKKDGVEKKVTENEYLKALKETPIIDITVSEEKNIWQVKVENPYGNGPQIMEFELNGEKREISGLRFS
ncbi:hypothetical protein ACFFIX_02965 [Metabacillus herbersteinensis]|uniref:Uncharacterized protein n=1 Tax=Metabacillus herbersteinensis TaxID=283816 RepID=A0ABV6G9S3_9BACI